jgi:dTDP-4-amino-4,6-dideoxy-D-galactose acyltransferase
MQLTSEISEQKHSFFFIDIPTEDAYLIQALCESGFRLTETRLHYALSNLDSYNSKRYPVRKATEFDIENLKKVAIKMRNPYDRLHADVAFTQDTSDKYLAAYIENSVRGFVDLVLVPAAGEGPPDAFLTLLYPVRVLDKMVSKLTCTAVSNETRKGWSVKLLSEMVHVLKDKGADYLLCDTQAPNRGVIRVLVSMGFSLAYVTHIFSKSTAAGPIQN